MEIREAFKLQLEFSQEKIVEKIGENMKVLDYSLKSKKYYSGSEIQDGDKILFAILMNSGDYVTEQEMKKRYGEDAEIPDWITDKGIPEINMTLIILNEREFDMYEVVSIPEKGFLPTIRLKNKEKNIES